MAEQEAGGEQVAGAGGVDHLVDRFGRDLDALAVLDRDARPFRCG